MRKKFVSLRRFCIFLHNNISYEGLTMVFTSKKSAVLLLVSSASLFAADTQSKLNQAPPAVSVPQQERLIVQSLVMAYLLNENKELKDEKQQINGKLSEFKNQALSSAATFLNEKTALAKEQEEKGEELRRLNGEYLEKIQKLERTKKYNEEELVSEKKKLEDEKVKGAVSLGEAQKTFDAKIAMHAMTYETLRAKSEELQKENERLQKENKRIDEDRIELFKVLNDQNPRTQNAPSSSSSSSSSSSKGGLLGSWKLW
jgi:hypothetical protein